MKALTTEGLTKLIQLSKDEFLSKDNTTMVTTSGLKTINGTSILGTGDISTIELPSQAGQSDKFLKTDGTDVSWNALLASDIPSLSLSKISDVTATAEEVNVLDGITATTAELNILDGATLTTTELNYVDGVTSGIQGQLNSKQETLVSGTNIKTVNGTTLLGSGNLDTFPSQTGNSGKFLTTNGSTVSWASVDAFPTQTGNSGKFLTTDGTAVSWATVDALPAQSGQSGKFLTTNGTDASWANLPAVDQTYSGTSTNAQSGTAVKQAIDEAISSVYKPAGSVAFANRPTLSSSIEGNVYNITDAFTTTSDFVEGAGKDYPAGTNIVCINTATSGTAVYKWDVLTGMVDLSGYQPLIDSSHKLSADLVDDSTSTNKFVTASDKTTWNAKQNAITGAATTITTDNLTANKAVISNASGKVATSNVTSTELGYLSGATSSIQTQIDGKVSKSGDTMTGNLQMSNSSVYLTGIGSVVNQSTSRLVLGTPENQYAYLTGNTSGAFGIYTEVDGERVGIACYPERNFFADGTTNTFELGRNTNVWKKAWIKEISDGTNTITTANIVAKQNAITGAATTITDSNLTADRAVVSDSSGKVAVSTVTSTELGYLSGVTSAVQTQLNGKQPTITGAATTVTSSNLDVNKALISNTSGKIAVSTVSATELGYISGVTSSIQTQLNGKQATISGGASTITSDNLAASKALVSNASGKVVVSDVTATELGYLSGVTSAVQTQLNGKQATLTSANAGAGITITNQVISETYPLAWEQVAESSDIPQFETHVYWGNIDGTLSNQTDLYNVLSAKSNDDAVVHLLGTETVIGTKNFTGSCTSNTPNASASTATEYIATTGWVNNPELSTNVVHRSGDETIGGQKTFTEVIQGTAYNAYYADLAEYYKTDKAYPKGTLVCFGGKEEMTEATSEVNAVISSDPGYVLNKQEDESYQPIALIGRVPVRVIGRVEKFDYIMLSKNIPGVAVATKDKNAKNIIGRALESSLLNREKLIECSIKLAMETKKW